MIRRDDAEIFGVNSRLDSLNAEVLSFRLRKRSEKKKRERKNLFRKYKNRKSKIFN